MKQFNKEVEKIKEYEKKKEGRKKTSEYVSPEEEEKRRRKTDEKMKWIEEQMKSGAFDLELPKKKKYSGEIFGNEKYIVRDIDPYHNIIKKKESYIPEYLGLKKLGPVTIICGQSNSGKSVILNNIFEHKLIYEYEPKNIYFFSKTIRGDLTYKPLLKYIASTGNKI